MKALDLTLYFVTDSTGKTLEEFLAVVNAACKGGVTLVQLREKDKSGAEYYDIAMKVKDITDSYGIPLIIDDRADIALAVNASGVHVGGSDLPIYAARKLLGADKIVGATAKTVAAAKKAEAEGADYLGVGAIYPTTTKVVTVITEVSVLDDIKKSVAIPVAAIGGLNSSNMSVLYGSSADGIAVVSAIMKSPDPEAAARSLKKQVLQNFASKKIPRK
ncbi:MAG: thiamine phosphate synthase [Clostridiales bacterium]|jgi:thiamine-phosphate pyrophosphorylase|nr:thiamine phosphate synthase [Clostridiales bacterium]